MADPLHDTARRFSANFPAMNDRLHREKKGRKIAAILRDALGDRSVNVLLDVGCSNAVILDVVVEQLKPALSIGIDLDAAAMPKPHLQRPLIVADGMELPIGNECVDVLICNHTYEHLPDAQRLFSELWRVLRPGGLVYFSAMNARWPIEPHYHLPVVHWLPRWASKWVLRLSGHQGPYVERPLGTAALRRLVSRFHVHDYTLRVINEPEHFEAEDIYQRSRFHRLYMLIARFAYGILPGYLWILVKPSAPSHNERAAQ